MHHAKNPLINRTESLFWINIIPYDTSEVIIVLISYVKDIFDLHHLSNLSLCCGSSFTRRLTAWVQIAFLCLTFIHLLVNCFGQMFNISIVRQWSVVLWILRHFPVLSPGCLFHHLMSFLYHWILWEINVLFLLWPTWESGHFLSD